MGEILKVFGKRVRALRRAKDMTQEQLAERAGLSLQSVGEIELGLTTENSPTPSAEKSPTWLPVFARRERISAE